MEIIGITTRQKDTKENSSTAIGLADEGKGEGEGRRCGIKKGEGEREVNEEARGEERGG